MVPHFSPLLAEVGLFKLSHFGVKLSHYFTVAHNVGVKFRQVL
jgi:hypothetical protein